MPLTQIHGRELVIKFFGCFLVGIENEELKWIAWLRGHAAQMFKPCYQKKHFTEINCVFLRCQCTRMWKTKKTWTHPCSFVSTAPCGPYVPAEWGTPVFSRQLDQRSVTEQTHYVQGRRMTFATYLSDMFHEILFLIQVVVPWVSTRGLHKDAKVK